MRWVGFIVITLLVGLPVRAEPVLNAMLQELHRAQKHLSRATPPMYFLAIEVTEDKSVFMMAEDGALQGYSPNHYRWVDVDVRVGDRHLDSTHTLRSNRSNFPHHGGRAVCLDDDQAVIQRELWREIDSRFNLAQERFAAVMSERKTLVEEEPGEDLDDTPAVKDIQPLVAIELDKKHFESMLRRCSALLASSTTVNESSVSFSASVQNRWFVSSAGAQIRHAESRFRLSVNMDTVASDGERLNLQEAFEAHKPSGLPTQAVLMSTIKKMEHELATLRKADEQEPYSGPAILSPRATAVFFHEILGHRLEGHRIKQIKDAQTFRNRVGKQILNTAIDVFDDPTLERFGKVPLFGHYQYDNQGVRAQKVSLIKKGILTGFLESRSPSGPKVRSNGHGRHQMGKDAVTRQGNLMIQAHDSVSDQELRQRLLQIAAERGLQYGLYLDEIRGGFTFTSRSIPNSFNVMVVSAKRIYLDGRPDEPIRGIDFIGTPLVTFSRIVETSTSYGVFNGYCGAESGSVPVSAVAPGILLSEIETQKKAKDQNTPPLLAPPIRQTAKESTP